MKKLFTMAVVMVGATYLSASAAFNAPTTAQLAQAAGNPAMLSQMLQGATAQEAAEAMRAVIVAALGLGLNADAQAARITQIVGAGFTAMTTAPSGGTAAVTPDAFAQSLGTALGSSPVLSQNGVVVATILSAVGAAGGGGTTGAALETSFTTALQTSVAANVPAKGYEIQQSK